MNSQRTAPRRRETIAAVLAFALACLAAVAPPAPARARQKEKTPEPKSVVRGRAVYADTERPVRRARVKLLNSDERGSERTGLTNERGEFEIKNVAAGSYILAVDAPGVVTPVGYIDIETRERPDLTEVSKNFEMVTVDGKAAYEVTVRARRGAALSGRVTYADGDPAPGLAVHVMRRAGAHYVKILSGLGVGAVMGARTDDRGVFRVSGLPPGEYVVGVSESAEHDDEGGRRDEEVAGFAEMFESYGRQLFTTFHPSALTAGEAAAVRVEAGEEREGLDIVVSERAARVVSGRVRGRADKRPVAGARVSIARRGDGAPAPNMTPYGDFGHVVATADSQGRWTLKNIPDGPYTLHVRPPEAYEIESRGDAGEGETDETPAAPAVASGDSGAGGGDVNEVRAAAAAALAARRARKKKHTPTLVEIEVAGGDLRDVSVELNEGAQIAGTFTFEGDRPPPHFWMLYARRVGPAGEEGPSGVAGPEGNNFLLEGLAAGKYFLVPSLPPDDADGGLYVKSMTWKGRDLLREPLEVAEGEAVEGVSIVFARGGPRLRVVARAAGDKGPVRVAHVFVVPPDAPHAASRPRSFQCTTGGDGSCVVTAAPGDYVVIVSRRGLAAEELARRAAGATRVSLSAGETETVEVTVPDK